MEKEIPVWYWCPNCELQKVLTWVPARLSEDVPADEWLRNAVVPEIMNSHDILSPECNVDTITQIIIPHPPDGWVGQYRENYREPMPDGSEGEIVHR